MKSEFPEQYKFTDRHGTELADYTFALVEELKSADAAINALITKLGSVLKLDSIAVREVVEEGKAVKCTYEWNKMGGFIMLGLEQRYLENFPAELEERYSKSPEGVYIYHKGIEELPRITRPDDVETLLQIPLYNGGKFIGCVDFINNKGAIEWNCDNIDVAKSVCRIMSSYLFGMRDVDVSRAALRDILKTDRVTGLPKYEEFLSMVYRSYEPDSTMRLVVCCADLTNFKYINERYGYDAGNKILKLFARAFYGFFNRTIACTREYSDNFCAAVKFRPDVTDDMIAEKFEQFAEYYIEHARIQISDSNMIVNVGICIMEKAENDIEDAIDNANVARKYARSKVSDKPSRVAVFTREMVEQKRETIKLISDLSEALKNDEFTVYYQPKVDCESCEIVGAEALVRWIRSDGRMVYPDMFIPAFEQDGCIVKVDYRVYEKVFRTLRRRLDAGLKCVPVSMNVSRVHLFSRAFVSYVDYLINRFKIPPELLEFEITESVYVDNLPTLMYSVGHLRAKGIKVSIDDFGSGYSSLDILTKVPVDIIKLDRVFMKEELSGNDKIIVGTIIDMAKRLGMQVLCEGVENEEQVAFLREAGCDRIQGYYFSKPVPEEDLLKMLETGKIGT